ncbi:MAG: hypothetical protein AAF664_17300 [Planctomycetota bacterium]
MHRVTQMIFSLRFLAILPVVFACASLSAQDQKPSEDQLIAEAVLSLIEADSDDPVTPSTAFREADSRYPNSAKVVYWRGRLEEYASDRVRVLAQVTETLKGLADPKTMDGDFEDPALLRRLQGMRVYARRIAERLEKRAQEMPDQSDQDGFEVHLLNAVTRDPTMIAAWAGLLESRDKTIALTAAEAWADQEPSNALPLYAKAIVLARDSEPFAPIPSVAIEALEKGNMRPFCLAPEEPWPTDFKLKFPDSFAEEDAQFADKPLTPKWLRKILEGMFFQLDAIGGGATFSGSAIRGLGSSILMSSHKLSPEEDVRHLIAIAGVGVHLVQSNRVSFVLSADSVLRTLSRLETIAIDQGDFEGANSFFDIRTYVLTTRRRVATNYLEADDKDKEDPAWADLAATKIMNESKKTISFPQIHFSEKPKSQLRLGAEIDSQANMIVLYAFALRNNHVVFVRKHGQSLPEKELDHDELSERGYATLSQSLKDLRRSNREERRSVGVVVVVEGKYVGSIIAGDCYTGGYVGKRDPCIVVFSQRERLEDFREHYNYVDLRLAQVLGDGNTLQSDEMENFSSEADLAIVDCSRLIEDGKPSQYLESTDLKFLVTSCGDSQMDLLERI